MSRVIISEEARRYYLERDLNWRPGDGVITFGSQSWGWAPVGEDDETVVPMIDSLRDLTDAELHERIRRFRALLRDPLSLNAVFILGRRSTVERHLEAELLRRRIVAFKTQHDLTDAEFEDRQWQTLFAIQYPRA